MKLKFITLNIWNGGLLFDSLLPFLKNEKPDILSCQEVLRVSENSAEQRYQSEKVIIEECGFVYHEFAPAMRDVHDFAPALKGNAVFSRFPIISSRAIFYDVAYHDNFVDTSEHAEFAPRNLQHAVIDIGHAVLNVFNTHGIWGLDGRDSERRLAMAETIIRVIKDKERVILSGDFNVLPQTQTIGNIEKHLANVFKDELKSSFNMKQKTNPGYASAVADHLFVSSDIKVVDHYCPPVDVSDHLPLVAVLEI